MPTKTINHHIIITDEEQTMIVNALCYYNAFNTFPSEELDENEQEHWKLCFGEDNRNSGREGLVDMLATKIANSN